MDQAAEILLRHHQHCDALFTAATAAVERSEWAGAAAACRGFRANLEAHISAEETVLFPAFESVTGMTEGPTRVMCQEHRQIKGLLEELTAACAARDAERYAGVARTLLTLVQQHNMKEEQILYPMCNQTLDSQEPALATRVAAMLEST